MKHFFVFSVLALFLFSCSGGGNKQQAEASVSAFELDDLFVVIDQKLNDTVTVVGIVTHTCKHSGKKCFIVGESEDVSLRIEAQGEIEEFTPELVGAKLSITGVIKEYQLPQEKIDEMENNAKQLQEEGENPEGCEAELKNICDMRKWMEDNDKDYYAIYYMDGLKYELLD